MSTLPQLLEEDIREFNRVLLELLTKSEASMAMVIDKGGFLITQHGQAESFDTTTLAALAAASFAATQSIASIVTETNFSSVYQQGEHNSILIQNVDEHCLLTVVFQARISVGAVKYFAVDSIKHVAAQMKKARQRNPEGGLDLSLLNLADTSTLFTRKSA
jgi:predicted regulator of Ras-like GTPase activity (Roadblock/LC7/MglB family)